MLQYDMNGRERMVSMELELKKGCFDAFDAGTEQILTQEETAETIVPDHYFEREKQGADIPHFMVEAVVHLPKGAAPCSCEGLYDIDRKALDQFKKLKTEEELEQYLTLHGKEICGRRCAGAGEWEW